MRSLVMLSQSFGEEKKKKNKIKGLTGGLGCVSLCRPATDSLILLSVR